MNHLFKRAIWIGAIFAFVVIFRAAQGGGLDLPDISGGQPPQNLPGYSIANMKEAADPSDCKIVKKSVPINIDPSRYPLTAKHAQDAIKAGEAKILHLDREGADENRDSSLAGIDTAPGKDRDEYPPAVTMEGGEGADVRLVPASDNRGAGSSMGAQLGDYCSGQAFVLTYIAQ